MCFGGLFWIALSPDPGAKYICYIRDTKLSQEKKCYVLEDLVIMQFTHYFGTYCHH